LCCGKTQEIQKKCCCVSVAVAIFFETGILSLIGILAANAWLLFVYIKGLFIDAPYHHFKFSATLAIG
jgi:hypothetical protein